MEITGTILHKKICEIFPEISSSITPEVLNRICVQSSIQEFLEWFCDNVTKNNILTDEDIQIKQHLVNTGKFLTEDLDAVVEETAKIYPELVQLIESKINGDIDHSSIFETEKEAFEYDLTYLQTLEKSLKTLTEQEDQLNDEIEDEQNQLEKETIDVKERYNDCVDLLRDFDEGHKLLHNDVEQLIGVYADAAELKGPLVVWTQMPLELCKNQTEMYINYLSAYIKRHFGNNTKDEHTNDSDYDTFMEDSRDRRGEDMLHELSSCLRNLITSRVEEATAKVSADACSAIEELAVWIYNNGNPKVPQTQAQLELEITELSGRRDFLEENVRLLRDNRLEEAISQSAEVAITEILALDARLRYERRERRLCSMLRLRELAREHGHAHSDLLCMLMELQFRRIMEAFEFVADARYYLSTEYSLSAARDNAMMQLQNEYETIESGSPVERNVYNKIFISMINGANSDDKDTLTSSMRELKRLVRDNDITEEKMFGVDIDELINGVKFLDQRIRDVYNSEINSEGRTSSLKPKSSDIIERTTNGINRVAELQKDVSVRRDRFKDHLRKNGDGFEWERSILWQRFLTDQESMRKAYEDARKKLDQLHYGQSY